MRVGIGYDVHRLVENRPLIVGGVEIPYELGLAGHSDADVLLHAITDALFGAAALGDIGTHFPDTDERFYNIDSLQLLAQSVALLKDRGFYPYHVDAVICAQRPKMAPHIIHMRQNIANTLALPLNSVSIKATTTEGLGFVGNEKGMAAHAVVTVMEESECLD